MHSYAGAGVIPEGQRHSKLVSLAGTMRRRGMEPEEILAALRAVNERRCQPPYSDGELAEIAHSMASYQPAEEPQAKATPPPGPAQLIALSRVAPERIEWLWAGRIPRGKIGVLDGDPSLGKSTITLDLAARVSTGRPMPDGTPGLTGGVVLLSAEDGLADTIQPRLAAAGADLSRIVALTAIGDDRLPELPEDVKAIEEAIEGAKAVLCVVDPLMAYLSGDVNAHRDQHVRRALAPLARMAERTRAAVLVVRHLNKGATNLNPLHRGGGSIGIIGAARAGLLAARDPDDPERRVLALTKSNLGKAMPALGYRVVTAQNGAAAIEWLGASAHSAESLLVVPQDEEQRSALDHAKAVLEEILGTKAVSVTEVMRQARAAGVSERTMERAKALLLVRAWKGQGTQGGWFWELPGKGAKGGPCA
jgi:hypothetical protein